MPYNLEEDEAHFKNESPYEMSDWKWAEMQQRIKKNVLEATSKKTQPAKIKTFHYWKIAATAACIFVLITIAFFFHGTKNVINQSSIDTNNMVSNTTIDPEKQLDIAIGNLNEAELNLSHQMSENEISEQNEYFDN